ncbi:MAG: hypothetical protein IPJ08_14080 [Burkholderiales bacterium]|nr:hypothetical protein [Burkholderiales bacterium]
MFQPHPAFAKDAQGNYVYHHMKPGELGERRTPMAFEQTGTRELVAEDLSTPSSATPPPASPRSLACSLEYVLGLKEYGDLIKKEDAKLREGTDPASQDKPFLDFRRWPLAGATAPEKHLLRIRIHGKYLQWKYWMQMTLLSPVPWEADAFYAQPGLAERGITLDQWPVGTGPFMVTEFVKDRRIVMMRNPNYRGEPYPCEGRSRPTRPWGCWTTAANPHLSLMASWPRWARSHPSATSFATGFDTEVFERTDMGKAYHGRGR